MSLFTIFKRHGKGKLHIPQASSDNIQNISGPTDIKQGWHVEIDDETGDFKGLPPAWAVYGWKAHKSGVATAQLGLSIFFCIQTFTFLKITSMN